VRIETYLDNIPEPSSPFAVDTLERPFIIFAAISAAFLSFGLKLEV
jgi:hypothetical protein